MDPVMTVPNRWARAAGRNFIGHDHRDPLVARYDFRGVIDYEQCLRGGNCSSDLYNPLVVYFSAPTDFVEVFVHFTADDLDGAVLRAYDVTGVLLDSCWFPGSTPTPRQPRCGTLVRRYDCNKTRTYCKTAYQGGFSRSTPDIAYVLWGGAVSSSTMAAISQIRFLRYSGSDSP